MMKEREIVDKDAVQKSKCRLKNKAELNAAYQGCPVLIQIDGDGVKTLGSCKKH